MTAIITKYHGPTNTRGSRITAYANGHKATISYPYELSGMDATGRPPKLLSRKWDGDRKASLLVVVRIPATLSYSSNSPATARRFNPGSRA